MPFSILAESLVDPVVAADEEGAITYANAAARDLFGYTEEQLIGAPLTDLMPERYRKAHTHGFRRFSATGEARVLGKRLELVGLRRDGTEFPIEITITHVAGPGPTRFVSVMRDLSARHRLEQQATQGERRVQELEHLRALQEFKTQFINKTAHELATPLTPIRTQAHVLARRLRDHEDPAIHKDLVLLVRNIDRLTHLVEGIVDAAMIQSHALGLDREVFDLAELTAACAERMRGIADVRGVTIEVALSTELMVHADPARIGQVITNLLSNAIRYNHPGGEVRVEAYVIAGLVRLMVRDTGVGIPPEEGKRLFNPYADVSQAGLSTAGAGLSLYISKGIMDLHGGRIWFESRGKDQGATFWISLPSHTPGGFVGGSVAEHEPVNGETENGSSGNHRSKPVP